MKTKMKRQGSTELPRFAVGALAIAGASAADAATVQITFNNSFISSTSGNQLDTDFGGDMATDLGGRFVYGLAKLYVPNALYGGTLALAGQSNGFTAAKLLYQAWVLGSPVAVAAGLVAFTLVDKGVNGGVATAGWLDVTATGRGSGEIGRVDVHRFIFDDTTGAAPVGVTTATTGLSEYGATSAVPEASTSLGLLALGAGGLLTRRRQKRAA
jgi:hypothetical protein